MTTLQLQRLGPSSSWKTSTSDLWRKAQAERRLKQRHAFTLESDQRYVAELCVEQTCKRFAITRTALLGQRRLWCVVQCRHVAMTAAYELSGLSSIVLGVKFNRDHTMVLHAQKRVNSDRALRAQADKVIRAVQKELRRK